MLSQYLTIDSTYRGGKYSEEDAKAVMVQILTAVAFCHLQGVVHRDLKPEVINYWYSSLTAHKNKHKLYWEFCGSVMVTLFGAFSRIFFTPPKVRTHLLRPSTLDSQTM